MVNHDWNQYKDWQELKVRWRDAYAPHSGWHEVDDYEPEDAVAVTIGRLWKDCQEHYITLVGTVFSTEDGTPKTVGDINHIPIAWIESVETISSSQAYPHHKETYI